MDKKTIELETRLTAIEYVLCEIGKVAFVTAGITPEFAERMRLSARTVLLSEKFPGADPALADHVTAEIADRVEDLLHRIEILVEASYLRTRQSGPET